MTTDLREDLEAAIKAVEDEATPEPVQEAAPESPQEPQTPEPPPEPQETGETAKEAAEAPADPQETDRPRPRLRRRDAQGRFLPDEAHPDDSERYPTLTDTRAATPPEGWRPAAREGWAELPEHIRREIHRRELDIATGQQQTASARDLAERFQATVTPFEPLMAAQGVQDPLEAVKGLLTTAATLQTGTPTQKAERLAQLFQHYSVDLEAFDAALAAQIEGKPGTDVPDPVKRALDERLAPLEQFVQQANQRFTVSEQAVNSQAAQDIASLRERAEFLDDVRLDMADLLDMADARGRSMTLDEAYDMACQMNPEIRALLDRRQQQTATQEAAKKAELADSSLSARQTAPATPPQSNGDLRSDILAAIDRLENP